MSATLLLSSLIVRLGLADMMLGIELQAELAYQIELRGESMRKRRSPMASQAVTS